VDQRTRRRPHRLRSLLQRLNLLGDIAESIGAALEFSDEELHVHEKLFWGCNIAAVTPSNERFVPEWPADQIDTLANALLDGLRLARDSIDTRID
jgi:hypothetical protein